MPTEYKRHTPQEGYDRYKALLTLLAQFPDDWDKLNSLSHGSAWNLAEFDEHFPALKSTSVPWDDIALVMEHRLVFILNTAFIVVVSV